jgi:hypothetical protein
LSAPAAGSRTVSRASWLVASIGSLLALSACSGESSNREVEASAQSCMTCHNGSLVDDYSGPGLENPHPFGNMGVILCTTCHGGNPDGDGEMASHVPPPPEIGDRAQQDEDAHAYFNRLTLAGVDKFPDYVVNGVTYSALDWLQFVNPGDVRIAKLGRGCGQCHEPHAQSVAGSPLLTQDGFLSAATYTLGVENEIPEHQGLYEDTAADVAFRAVQDSDSIIDPNQVGAIARLVEFPVFSQFGGTGPDAVFDNPLYDAAQLLDDRNPDGSAITGSPLANLFHEQVAFTCADCHLGSAGANNRYGDFRSSGCTSCHMRYSLDGRSTSGDPNVPRTEPLNPDQIDDPERPHIRRHLVQSVAKTLPGGEFVQGIDDYTCAGCHQGSNRTVLQFWGIRLDQNADLEHGLQYPANPVSFVDTRDDTRLYDPVVDNNTFNGRKHDQYILFEDYDGDGRDDTPPDVHYEAGLGCIDCHGSNDLHGTGLVDGGTSLVSRMEQAVAIRCESCHGDADAYAETKSGIAFDGTVADLAVDRKGNVLNHVIKEATGRYWLTSKLTGVRHYVPQTRDAVVKSAKQHPVTHEPLYDALASYAMGRDDGLASNGIGPKQTGIAPHGFSHMDRMSCAACHSSWANNCIGCHLRGDYNTGNNFSNITGERIVYRQTNADFTYQTPVPFQLGVNADGKIAPISPNTEAFYGWRDRNGEFSAVTPFTDRNGGGNNSLDSSHPSLSHNLIMPHSIRGKVQMTNEGPRYCVACHLTNQSIATWGTEYDQFRTAINTGNFGALDFPLLATHIGQNPGNQIDSPIWVHMVAGLGTGLFLFDESGCAVNPLDTNVNRVGCNGEAPADHFDPARVKLNLDRIVDPDGHSNGSNSHTFFSLLAGPELRDGASNPNLTGPLGATLIQKLTDPTLGVVLDSWLDADAAPHGDAAGYLDD